PGARLGLRTQPAHPRARRRRGGRWLRYRSSCPTAGDRGSSPSRRASSTPGRTPPSHRAASSGTTTASGTCLRTPRRPGWSTWSRAPSATAPACTQSSRQFIGDAARDLARLLPGQWHTSIEIYSHPAWQEDLVPWIWDSGELGRILQNERVPYAATLTDTVQGT